MSTTPIFSFVATSRNDDHGGDVLRRTQSFINRLAEQCERHQVSGELVLVDWNPPPARAPLADVLGWPAGGNWFSARVVSVPPALHRQLRYSSRLAMYQMIAKNVGIRLAQGNYIIATNIDIIFSDELFRWLKSGIMREGVLYRSDRWDIPNEIQLEPDLDVLLERARREAIRCNLQGTTGIRQSGPFVVTPQNRFDDEFYFPLHDLIEEVERSLMADAAVSADQVLEALDKLVSFELPRLRAGFIVPTLHTNACGDFTMLSRRDWFRLRGYPEWNIFSWHIDSIFLYQAHYAGLKLENLGDTCVHYHIEHDYGSGWTPEGAESLWTRLNEHGIPFITYERFREIVAELRDNAERKVQQPYNDSDWGYAGHRLECRSMVEPGSPKRLPRAVNEAPLTESLRPRLVPFGAGSLFDAVEAAADGVSFERRLGNGGPREIVVETRPEIWSYALLIDLEQYSEHRCECWIRISLFVDSGNVGISALKHDGSEFFIMHASGLGAKPQLQQILAYLPEIGEIRHLALRNVTAGNQSARFRLSGVELLQDEDCQDEPDISRPTDADAPTSWMRGTGAGVDVVVPIRTNGAGTIVRALAGEPALERNDNAQTVIVLPPASEGAEAILDLSDAPRRARKVVVHLHVLEGAVAIGLRREDGEMLAARQEGPGRPLTRIAFDMDSASAPLVIKNAVPAAYAKLMLHRIEYETDRLM